MKKGIELLTLKELFELYHVDGKFRNYKVYVDRQEADDPNSLLAERKIIKDVFIDQKNHNIEIITTIFQLSLELRKKTEDAKRLGLMVQ